MITDWQCNTQCLTLCGCNERLPQSVRCPALRARAICSAGRLSCCREWRSQASIADFGAHYTASLKSSDISLLAWRNSWNSNRLPIVKGPQLIWQIQKRSQLLSNSMSLSSCSRNWKWIQFSLTEKIEPQARTCWNSKYIFWKQVNWIEDCLCICFEWMSSKDWIMLSHILLVKESDLLSLVFMWACILYFISNCNLLCSIFSSSSPEFRTLLKRGGRQAPDKLHCFGSTYCSVLGGYRLRC